MNAQKYKIKFGEKLLLINLSMALSCQKTFLYVICFDLMPKNIVPLNNGMNHSKDNRNAMENKDIFKEKAGIQEYAWFDKLILIVEDIELNFLYLRELLEPTGAMIIRVDNGKMAVDYCLSHENIDIVLMDIMMPVMNGYEATRQIKMHNKLLPIIVQTAYAHSEDRTKAMVAGCDDFIAKPIGKEELLKKISFFFKNNTP